MYESNSLKKKLKALLVYMDTESHGCVSVLPWTGGRQAATVRSFSQRGGAEKCDDASVAQLPLIHRNSWTSGAVAGGRLPPPPKKV